MRELKLELVQEVATAIESNEGSILSRDLITETLNALKNEPGFESWDRVTVGLAINLR